MDDSLLSLEARLTRQGSNYLSILSESAQVRAQVQAGFTVFSSIEGQLLQVIGEDEGQFLLQKADGSQAVVSDGWFDRSVDGMHSLAMPPEPEKPIRSDRILLDDTRVEWDSPDRLKVVRDIVRRINGTDRLCALPPHPVALVLTNALPEGAEGRGARAWIAGATIYLVDRVDPLSEILHELGHVYYRTRLTQTEILELTLLHSRIDGNNPQTIPAIFENTYDFASPEEMFCTLYVFMLKGYLIQPGYLEILRSNWSEAAEFMQGIFDRIRWSAQVEESWTAGRKGLVTLMKAQRGDSHIVSLSGRRVRARTEGLRSGALPEEIPAQLLGQVYRSQRGVDWVELKDSLFQDLAVPVKTGTGIVDYAEIDRAGQNTGTVPVTVPRIRKGRVIHTSYQVRPSALAEGRRMVLQKAKRLEHVERSDESFPSQIWSRRRADARRVIGEVMPFFDLKTMEELARLPMQEFHRLRDKIQQDFEWVGMETWEAHFTAYWLDRTKWDSYFSQWSGYPANARCGSTSESGGSSKYLCANLLYFIYNLYNSNPKEPATSPESSGGSWWNRILRRR